MTIKELTEQKIRLRSTDVVKANIFTLLLDACKKIAKEEHKEVDDSYIVRGAEKLNGQLHKSLEACKNAPEDVINVIKREIAIIEEFLPKKLSEEETREFVTSILNSMEDEDRNMKTIMPLLKEVENIDMKIASKLVKELI